MKIWHMSGAGNDFLVVDARNKIFDMEKMAKKLCSFYGADGFMALDNSCIADIKLHFYNNDGSRAQMCGNGARCICRFAFDNRIVDEKMCVETDAGLVFGERIDDCVYKIKLNDPQNLKIDSDNGLDYVEVGVHHTCVEVSNVDWFKKDEFLLRARDIRFSSEYQNGTNVNFYSIIDKNTVKILTYERGVEDFTFACGTGSGAVAVILWAQRRLNCGKVTVKNQGGDLRVSVCEKNGEVDAVYLEGNTEILKIFDLVEEEL